MELNKTQVEQICKKLNEKLVRFRFLARGNHNSNYLLETTKNKYIIRIEDNQQFKNLKKEFNFLKLAKAGLGPKVLLFDNSHKIIPKDHLIEEFIIGEHPSEKNPANEFVVQMAKWFRQLHKTRKKLPEQYSLMKKVKPYYNNYLKYKNNIKDKKLKEKLGICIAKALKILEKNDAIFADRKNVSLLHNDVSKGNIFYKSGHIRLIDWEFVNYGLPEKELVYFLDSYQLKKSQQKLFLKSYGYPNTKKAKIQLNMIYIILLFSSIGYSLWQLDILRKDKNKRIKRLIRDVNMLEEKITHFNNREEFELKGVNIIVNESVFSPDPNKTNSSIMVLNNLPRLKGKDILDMGCGSGVIAIYCALHGARKVIAADNDERAIKNAKENVKRNNVGKIVKIIKSDLFENIKGSFDYIFGNLPISNRPGAWNLDIPTIDLLKKFVSESKNYIKKGGIVYFTWYSSPSSSISPVKRFLSKNYKFKEIKETKGNKIWYLFKVQL